MDESWRMKMGGLSAVDPFFSIARKSMEDRIDAEDFADVFGGPPRTLLTRKLSGDFSRSDCFYDEIFHQSGLRSRPLPSSKSHGRNLPAFRIPSSGDGFYDGVFGSFMAKEGSTKSSIAKSKSKSRSNSSSVLTSEEVSPHYPPPPAATSSDDTAFSSFTSRLRPLNVPSRSQKPETKKQNFPAFRQAGDSFSVYENTPEKSDFYCKNSQFSSRRASPETISLDPCSFRSKKLSMDDYGPSSPASSPVSTVNNEEYETEVKQRTTEDSRVEEEEYDDEDDEEMSSYVIEINSDRYDRNREEGGGCSDSNDMDEAIAWAKERSQRPETNKQTENSTTKSEEDEIDSITIEDEGKSEEEIEMEMKDEEIRIWLTGKQTNIRLLLSTLHHVLWSNSGWHAISLANLRDGSQVKKAYQKARLCLHPDKLQQRGALVMQKSVANRVFSVLQEAWAVYVTKEGLSS